MAVLADSDTRWKWGALTARRLSPEPGAVHLTGFLLRGRATPTARQLGEVGVKADRLTEVTCAGFLAELSDPGREPYDVVVLALVGGAVQAVLHGARALWPGPGTRPVFVTGYVGVVYEKLADGLLLRHGADLVLANSRHDAGRFREVYEGVGADASAVVETALPFLDGAPYEPVGDTPHRVVFAVQPSVPEGRTDRAYLLGRAVEHARLHPEREVLIKLRSRPGEHTTHLEELPYQRLAERLPGGLPANCRLAYGNMGEVLDTTDLLVTVSSTAALESLHRGIPTAVLTDLGIRESLGNHHFLGSGCLASWTQLDAGLLPKPNPHWLASQGVGHADPLPRAERAGNSAPADGGPAPDDERIGRPGGDAPTDGGLASLGARTERAEAPAPAEAGLAPLGGAGLASQAGAGLAASAGAGLAAPAEAGLAPLGEAGLASQGEAGLEAPGVAGFAAPAGAGLEPLGAAGLASQGEAGLEAPGVAGFAASAGAGLASQGEAGLEAPGVAGFAAPDVAGLASQAEAGLAASAGAGLAAGTGAGRDTHAAARARLAELLGQGGQLPPLAPYYTQATAPGYLPGILARHHLGPDGSPLPGAAGPRAGESRLRRKLRAHLREAARGAYRHGVQRVAPVIRRLGEL